MQVDETSKILLIKPESLNFPNVKKWIITNGKKTFITTKQP